MKRSDVDAFEKLVGQLQSLHSELTTLAKKSPNNAVNAFKLKFVNSTLDQCNAVLGSRYMPFADFTGFTEDSLPSNSDATFIISQYLECSEKFRSDNIIQEYGSWYWIIDGEYEDDRSAMTAPPKKLAK